MAPGSDGAELWWGFLDTVTCGNTELAEYLQTVAGMAVLGKVFTETLLIATGTAEMEKAPFSILWPVSWATTPPASIPRYC